MKAKTTSAKSALEITKEWDNVAKIRESIFRDGNDPSFEKVLAPHVLKQFESSNKSLVLDVGCGTGELTKELSKFSHKLTAIEPSTASVEIARQKPYESHVDFFVGTIEEFGSKSQSFQATTIVTSMTLMCCPNLDSFVAALDQVSAPGCQIISTLTHPCFWPRYWSYESEAWFDYSREIFVEAPFKTSAFNTNLFTTHIHRPVSTYLNTFEKYGFSLSNVAELRTDSFPDQSASSDVYPRFLSLVWDKGNF